MPTPMCGVCHEHASKYKCPVCELRYCSIPCYKSHKQQHTADEATIIQLQQRARRDRPGTTQRVPKLDFTGFEHDADFKRLLTRYPALKAQLQLAYALTLEPGPREKWTWNKQPLLAPLYPSPQAQDHVSHRGGRGRGRGAFDRGRGRGMRGSVRGGGRHGGNFDEPPEDRQHAPWTREKGEKEARLAVKKMRMDGGGEEDGRAEGMREFGELCQIKFGADRETELAEGTEIMAG